MYEAGFPEEPQLGEFLGGKFTLPVVLVLPHLPVVAIPVLVDHNGLRAVAIHEAAGEGIPVGVGDASAAVLLVAGVDLACVLGAVEVGDL